MGRFLYEYELNATTWIYLSSLMTVAIYFRFGRLWSVRNLDLIALIALAPGILLISLGDDLQLRGYVWLFSVSGFFLVRMLIDSLMVRRPLLEPNLSTGGLVFMTVSLLVFLMSNVLDRPASPADLEGPRWAHRLLEQQEAPAGENYLSRHGPGYPVLHLLATLPNQWLLNFDENLPEDEQQQMMLIATARTMAILAHLAIVVGMVLIGYRHFGSLRTGIAAAALYLLLPYTAIMVSRVDHVLPAAIVIWAIAAYRRPLLAGILIGLTAGVAYCAVFLLPLWTAFYWQRGRVRFLIGFIGMMVLLIATLALTASNLETFAAQLRQMFGFPALGDDATNSFWNYNIPVYRIPVMVGFVALSVGLALWPPQKNLGTLLSCSAAVMIAAQFWIVPEGGLFIAWYLPLLLLTIFRPNLEDRVALSVLDDGRVGWRRHRATHVERAA